MKKITKSYLTDLTYQVNGAAIEIHKAQVLTYMRFLEVPEGIIYNFNVVNLYKEGQKTFVNEFFSDLEE